MVSSCAERGAAPPWQRKEAGRRYCGALAAAAAPGSGSRRLSACNCMSGKGAGKESL